MGQMPATSTSVECSEEAERLLAKAETADLKPSTREAAARHRDTATVWARLALAAAIRETGGQPCR